MGERECRSSSGVAANLLSYGNGAPGQFEFLLIETLGHQIPAANVDHISVGIFTTVVRARQGCIQLRIECAQVNTSPRSNRRITHKLEKQKVPSVWQKPGPALRRGYRPCGDRGTFLLWTHSRGWTSTRCRNAQQGRGWIRRKHNRTLNSPRATASVGSVRQGLHRPSAGVDDFQFALRKESQAPAIGRPEGKTGFLGSRQRLSCGRIQRANPKLRRHPRSRCHKRQAWSRRAKWQRSSDQKCAAPVAEC